MNAAAEHDGISLSTVSVFRTNADQAKLFAATPTRSGSRRREVPAWPCTELDPSPASALGVAGAQRAAVRVHQALQLGTLALRLGPNSLSRLAPWTTCMC